MLIYNFFKKIFGKNNSKSIKYKIISFTQYQLPSLKHFEINNLDINLVHLHWVQHETISIEEIGKIKFQYGLA